MRKLIGNCLNLPQASQQYFNYFLYKLISKDTQLQLWNSQTEPNKNKFSAAGECDPKSSLYYCKNTGTLNLA